MKKLIISIFLIILCVSLASAGSKKYNSKGAGQSKRPAQTIMEQQTYMHWLQQGCPPLVQPRQQQIQRPDIKNSTNFKNKH
jgi:hypothetical protein